MDIREQQRLRMTRDVLRLVRVRDFRAALPPLTDGVAPIVIGFRNDTIKCVVDQIGQLGGSAHVVIPPKDLDAWPDGMALLQVQKGQPAGDGAPLTDDDCPVKPESELGMLLELLMVRRRRIRFHICHREATVELVDDGQPMASA